MTTIAEIAKEAFDDVAAEFTDVIKDCTLTRTIQDGYDPSTGAHSTTTVTSEGRAVFDTSTAIADALQGYVAGPGELLVYLEGLAMVPKENDAIVIGGEDFTIVHVGDVVGAGSFHAATVVPS